MDAKLPGFVTAGRYNTPFITSHKHRLPFQGRVIEDLDGNKKRVEVKVGDITFRGQEDEFTTKEFSFKKDPTKLQRRRTEEE
jgi:hypothetical protein